MFANLVHLRNSQKLLVTKIFRCMVYTSLTSHIYSHHSLLLHNTYTLHPTESHNMWQTYTNLPSLGQSQVHGEKLRFNLDKDVFRLEPNRTWWKNTLGRVAPPASLSVNVSRVLLSSSAFSISFSNSMSLACITHQHSPQCNGMGRNTNYRL